MSITKGKQVIGYVHVASYGSSCVGRCPWETPYVRLVTPKDGSVIYQSDRVCSMHQTIKGTPASVGFAIKVRLILSANGVNVRRFSFID